MIKKLTKNFRKRILKASRASLKEHALTFLEIMIVLIIIGAVMATLGQRLLGAGDKAKANLTEISMKQLKQDIEQFRLRYNALPTSLDDLVKCSQLTGASCVPISQEESLIDAWGGKFVYRTTGNSRTYEIKSLGADGRDGGDGVSGDISVTGP